ncbi:hypothetical protein [Sporisorium scitamineum]|uniref:Uncharacterized protein n=1 Tax=Sporisorium scitamineum TaxID=49012 RepID=A0A0F7RWK1_9BASI|nr:hypothetical protein [Sporisorium scitamineum]
MVGAVAAATAADVDDEMGIVDEIAGIDTGIAAMGTAWSNA